MSAVINVSDSALFGLLLEGLEAYSIKHDNKYIVALETHAQLWGETNKSLPFKCHVNHISVDSSAVKSRGEVAPSALSLEMKKDIAHMFGGDYQHLGSFHTHPWLIGEKFGNEVVSNANFIRKKKLYDFSNGDHACEIGSPIIQVKNIDFSIALVMTIFTAEKADDRKDGEVTSDLYEFSLGNIKVWLKAQVYEHKAIESLVDIDIKALEIYDLYIDDLLENKQIISLPVPVKTTIVSPFFDNLDYYLKKFGRLNITSRKSYYSTAREAEKRPLVI